MHGYGISVQAQQEMAALERGIPWRGPHGANSAAAVRPTKATASRKGLHETPRSSEEWLGQP